MSRGLLVVDVQRDFCEGGSLGVDGGNAVASGIAQLLMDRPGLYTHIFVSQDWHNAPPDDNGGHFAIGGDQPDYVTSWPVHCVAHTPGADIHPVLMGTLTQLPATGHLTFVHKGQGRPDYSAFQGLVANDEKPLEWGLRAADVTSLDIVGIATDHCVLASGRDALSLLHQHQGGKPGGLREVRVVEDLCAGVNQAASREGLKELETFGATITRRRYL